LRCTARWRDSSTKALGRHAPHYSDLYALSGENEVRAMLASDEYEQIRKDNGENSSNSKCLARIYRAPKDLSFADSRAFFPDAELKEQLAGDYETQCRLLVPTPALERVDLLKRRPGPSAVS
jgi:hypothetical protein